MLVGQDSALVVSERWPRQAQVHRAWSLVDSARTEHVNWFGGWHRIGNSKWLGKMKVLGGIEAGQNRVPGRVAECVIRMHGLMHVSFHAPCCNGNIGIHVVMR